VIQFTVDDKSVILDITDTAGQSEYSSIRESWIRKCQAFLLVCALHLEESLHELRNYVELILQIKNKSLEELPIILVCNHFENCENKISLNEFLSQFNIKYVILNAKNYEDCNLLFVNFVKLIRNVKIKNEVLWLKNKIIPNQIWYELSKGRTIDEWITKKKKNCNLM